jgi:hypothetical protein
MYESQRNNDYVLQLKTKKEILKMLLLHFRILLDWLYCGEPAISHDSHHVSLVQWTTCLLPVTRDPGSNPRGGPM